jgi:hypothetical protein
MLSKEKMQFPPNREEKEMLMELLCETHSNLLSVWEQVDTTDQKEIQRVNEVVCSLLIEIAKKYKLPKQCDWHGKCSDCLSISHK